MTPPRSARSFTDVAVLGGIISGVLLVLLSLAAPPFSAESSAADAEPPPLVAKPQHAILLLSPTDTRHIWLVSLAPKQLTYTVAEHETATESLAADRDRRVAVKLLSGDIYAVDPRSGRFTAFDELTGRFAAVSHDDARQRNDAAESGPNLHTEIAEGSGATASDAITDALRNAVRQAVGVYVDSETLTDKDDVVSDKVLTVSDAFVVRYEELARSTADGLVTVKVSADIESGKLMENLRTAKVGTLELSGADLVASAITRKESRDNAADLLYRRFCELPNVLDATALPFKPLDYDAEKQLLTVTYTLSTDREKYAALLEKLVPLLEQICRAKTLVTVKVNPIWSDRTAPVWQDATKEGRGVAAITTTDSGPFRLGPDLSGWPGSWCLWLLVRGSSNHRTTQWAGYVLDVDLPRTLGHVTGSMQVRLDLVAEGGETLHTETHDPLDGLPRPAYWFGWARPRPRGFQAANPRLWPPSGTFPTAPILKTTFREPEFAIHENRTVNLYVSPLCYSVPGPGQAILSPGAWQVCPIKIPPDLLGRVRSIEATPVFVSTEPTDSSR
jgi:hypothetical protein